MSETRAARLTRRRLLQLAGLTTAGALASACGRGAALAPLPAAMPTITPTLTPTPDVPITPIGEFFTVAYAQGEPPAAAADWRLTVGGLVERPLALNLAELRTLPAVTEMRTLLCISIVSGGDGIGNAIWQGVRLRDLLQQAGLREGVREIKLESFDGYSTAIPIELALDERSLLVYAMNGAPLPPQHGAPLRALFPGRYGMKQPKWLQAITAITEPYLGLWEKVGWSNAAIIAPYARIDAPPSRTEITTEVFGLSGVAFADDSGVGGVDVGWDAAGEWRPATVVRGPSPLTWVTWTWSGAAPAPGLRQIFARATDGRGRQQTHPAEICQCGDPFPDGDDSMPWIMLDFKRPTR